MTTLYIRTIEDDPHAMDPEVPGLSKCGEVMLNAKAITQAQAIIWLDDRRCSRCFPQYHHKGGRNQKASRNTAESRAKRWLASRAA